MSPSRISDWRGSFILSRWPILSPRRPGLGRMIGRLIRGGVGDAVQSLGRNSLAVFAAGSLMSAGGQAALAAASPHASTGS